MPAVATYTPGTFCWPELCSADATASKKFYSSIFGWESRDLHMHDGDYTLFTLRGQNVGAMYEMADNRKQAGVVPHWNSYLAVANVDEIAIKATSLGGKVLMPPFEGDGNSMANLQDPTGANFSVWQTKAVPQATRLNEVGALCWTELYTRDPEKASNFYAALFGWRPEPWKEGPMPYAMFNLANEDRPAGGMLAMPKEMPGSPHWLPYFQVEDADASAEHAEQLDGQICNPPMDIPSIGRMSMLADPQGAAFAIIKLSH